MPSLVYSYLQCIELGFKVFLCLLWVLCESFWNILSFVIFLAISCFIEFSPLLSVFNFTNFCSLLPYILLILELFCVSFSDLSKKHYLFESFSASCCPFLYFGSSFQISFSCFDLKHFHSVKCIMVHICFLSTRNGYVLWQWLVECPPMPIRSCERMCGHIFLCLAYPLPSQC